MTENLGNAGEGQSQGEETGQETIGNSSLSVQNKKRRGRQFDRETRAAELEVVLRTYARVPEFNIAQALLICFYI